VKLTLSNFMRVTVFATLFLGLASNVVLLAGQDAADSDAHSTVRGTVIDAVTHEPINRALVTSSDNRFATLTDSEGHFEFTMPGLEKRKELQNSQTVLDQNSGLAANIVVSLAAARFLTGRKPGYLENQGPEITVDPSTHEIVIALQPEALITGHATLPTADPAAGLSLELYRRMVQDGRAQWISVGSVQTRSNGEFRFAGLSPGTYKVFTREMLDRDPQDFNPGEQLYGYPPVYFPGASDFAGGAPIELSPGKNLQADLSLTRQAYYPVKIPVVNLRPGTFLNVDVSVQGHRGPGYSLGFNPRNQVITGMLPSGNYTLEATGAGSPSFVTDSSTLASASDKAVGVAAAKASFESGTLNITVKNGPLDGPRMTVVPASSIRLNVKEDFTSPTNSAAEDLGTAGSAVVADPNAPPNPRPPSPRDYLNVQLRPAEDFTQDRGTFLRPAAGPEDDSLWLDNVTPGRYWVETHITRGYVASMLSGTVDLLHNPLVVPAGGSVPPIEITVRNDAAHIEGKIENVNETTASPGHPGALTFTGIGFAGIGAPISYIYCIPLPDSPGQFVQFNTSPDGTFNSPEVAPGTYRVIAFKQPNIEVEYRNPDAMRAFESEGVVIHVGPDGKETVRLRVTSRSE